MRGRDRHDRKPGLLDQGHITEFCADLDPTGADLDNGSERERLVRTGAGSPKRRRLAAAMRWTRDRSAGTAPVSRRRDASLRVRGGR